MFINEVNLNLKIFQSINYDDEIFIFKINCNKIGLCEILTIVIHLFKVIL